MPAKNSLPRWARIADGLTLLLAVAAVRVAVFGGIRLGTVFSMSTPWRALIALTLICCVRHYLAPAPPLHSRIRIWIAPPVRKLLPLAARCRSSPAVRFARGCGRRSLKAYQCATRMTVSRALHLFALTAIAVAHPLFDVVSREPAFFVARNTTSAQLAAITTLIVVALPLLLVFVEAIFARLHARAGSVVHMLLVALLLGLLLLPVLQRAGVTGAGALFALALLPAGAAALGCHRSTVIPMFLTALSPAAIVVPAVFLTNADVRGVLITSSQAIVPARVEYAPPIVFVVFDEFPTSSLMNAEREIDRGRYPHFARLADDATWFRNASTVSSQTVWAVPAIVAGRYPLEPHAVPTARYYPNNLFSMLSDQYRMTVFGRFLQLCPADACTYDLEVRDSLTALAADLLVVYLHIITPEPLAARLPPIVGDWRGFAGRRMFRETAGERSPNLPSDEYDRFLQTITPEASGRLYFLHTLTPHMPFRYVPSGTRYNAPDYQAHQEGGERLFLNSDPWMPVILQQRHLLQLGFVDRFIGNLIDRLQAQGIYEESLIVVTADHGTSFRHGMPRRTALASDPADIVQVPLIVKLPRQTTGAIRDDSVETVDIVPTIADALGTAAPYEVDGRSLLDPTGPERPNKTFVQRNYERIRVEEFPSRLEEHSLAQMLRRFESGLYGVGPHASLVGRSTATLDVVPGTESAVNVQNVQRFDNVDVEAEALPLYLRGTLASDVNERVSLGIGLNGVLVATTVSYLERGRWVFASMIPEEALAPGANEVEVVVLGGAGDDPMMESDRTQ